MASKVPFEKRLQTVRTVQRALILPVGTLPLLQPQTYLGFNMWVITRIGGAEKPGRIVWKMTRSRDL